MWRWYCSESSGAGIWNLHAIEAELEKLPPMPSQGESVDFYGYEIALQRAGSRRRA
jgi:hypothetical protein